MLGGSLRRPTVLLLLVGFIFTLYSLSNNRRRTEGQVYPPGIWSSSSNTHSLKPLNRKIWQSSRIGLMELDKSNHDHVDVWNDINPTWRYELLTDQGCDEYVRERFAKLPEIVEVFTELKDNILRADLIRYLVLLADGGVYSDMDTDCLKPIDDWIPAQYQNSTNAAVGVEYDTFGLGRGPALLDLQLVNWTIMSKAGHPLMELTVRNAIKAIKELAAKQKTSLKDIQATFNDVLVSTGPARLTLAVFEYLSEATGTAFTWQNITNIKEPMLVHDILIFPVTAFGNGQSHSNAGPPTDEAALVHHLFSGSWKTGIHAYKNMDEASSGTTSPQIAA